MAKRRISRSPYRMTPARRAALHRAQLISAKKRRRAKLKSFAVAAGTVAGAAAVYGAQAHLNRYASNPREAIKDYRDVKGFVDRRRGKGKDPNAPGPVKRVNVSPLSRRSVRHHMGVRSVAGRRIRSR